MQMKIFSIRDKKAQAFQTPWYKNSMGEAERDFQTACNDEKSFLNKYPQDFDLYYLGQIDLNSGQFETLDSPEHVVSAFQLTQSKT